MMTGLWPDAPGRPAPGHKTALEPPKNRRRQPWGFPVKDWAINRKQRTYSPRRFFVPLLRNARRISGCRLSEIPSFDASIAVALGLRPSLAAIRGIRPAMRLSLAISSLVQVRLLSPKAVLRAGILNRQLLKSFR